MVWAKDGMRNLWMIIRTPVTSTLGMSGACHHRDIEIHKYERSNKKRYHLEVALFTRNPEIYVKLIVIS
jgi:hypothetical protein